MFALVIIAALIIGGALWAFLGTAVPFYIALAFIGTLIIWTISDAHPKFNAFVTFVAGLIGAIVVQSIGVNWIWICILGWIGYVKTHRVWGEVAYYDYITIDEKIYQFFDEAGTDAVHIFATLLSIAFYVILGALAYNAPALAFIVPAFLFYRMIRVFCAAA